MKYKTLLFIHTLNNSGAPLSTLGMGKVLKKNGFTVEIWSFKAGILLNALYEECIPFKILDENDLYTADIKKRIGSFDLLIANTIETYKVVQLFQEIIPTVWLLREGKNLPGYLKNRECYITLKRANNLYVISEYVRDYVLSKLCKKHVKVLHNFIEDVYKEYKSESRVESEIIKVLCLGTICSRKAQDVVIKAYKQLNIEYQKKCIIYFAGECDENERNYCRKFIKNVERYPQLLYLGNITDRNALYKMIYESDIVLQVSRDDACSRVVIESCMMAKPVIISQNVGAAYMVEQNSGWMVKTNDADDLKEILKQIIEEPKCLNKMGKMARKSYLDTSTDSVYEKNLMDIVHANLDNKIWYRYTHLFDRVIYSMKRRFLDSPFSSKEIRRGSRIVLYGAGKQGQIWKKRLGWSAYCNIVLWVDINYKNLSRDVRSPADIKRVRYDYIIVAIYEKCYFDQAERYLMEHGIREKQIKWCRKL